MQEPMSREIASEGTALGGGAMSRRTFLKGALAAGVLASLSGALSACSSDQASSSASASAASSGAAASSASSGAAESSSAASGGAAGSSVLVAYYSAQGHTEAVAHVAADELGADMFAITPANPYTADDLNYNNEASRVSVEHEDANRHVELAEVTPANFDAYDTVLVGYPIWWGEASWVVDDFVAGNDFSDKTVIPFCTSASSPLGQSGQLLAEAAGTGVWQEGRRFSSSVSEDDVRTWAAGLRA